MKTKRILRDFGLFAFSVGGHATSGVLNTLIEEDFEKLPL
jgi:hypothetical protein